MDLDEWLNYCVKEPARAGSAVAVRLYKRLKMAKRSGCKNS